MEYLRIGLPFLMTLALWRLSTPWINPAGILAIIPIFYCSFIHPTPYFVPYALFFCFLIDYKFNTVLTWTIFYCIYYVTINLQTIIDITHTNMRGIFAFMLFFGIVLFAITLFNLTWLGFGWFILTFLITCIMYIPITKILAVVHDD